MKGNIVSQKLRYKDKKFIMIGNPPKRPTFWGQHLFSTGKRVIITEGEFDAMSMYEAMGSSWPVVSLPNGAASTKKVFQAQSKWLEGFEEVVLSFDEDAAGDKAREVATGLLPPGRARITKLSLKDANELWRASRGDELKQAVWNAKQVRPDTILGTEQLWDKFTESLPNSYIPLPWSGLQDMWKGWRDGEITLIGAGSGVGKTTLIKQMLCHAIDQGDKVGGIFLEESVRRTVQGMLTYYSKIPVHLTMLGNYEDLVPETQMQLQSVWEDNLKSKIELYDHFGTMDPKELVSNLRYMAIGLGCKTLVLDHITMLANAAEDGNERIILDSTMQKLRAMVEETGARLVVISHLNRPSGKPFEEGANVHLGSFRGSTQLVCLSDNVLGIERNQQHPTNADYTRLRSLKCRITGDTGIAGWLLYSKSTGCMIEVDEPSGGLLSENQSDIEETYENVSF
jgi:twinkle protein